MTARLVAVLRDRGHRRREDGFALAVVLTAIGVFSIVVVALLGLMFTDIGFRSVTRDVAAHNRAVDGALEAAASQLAGPGVGGAYPGACTWTGGSGALMPVQVDGTSVDVECSFLAPDPTGPPVPVAAGRAVTLTGSYSTVVPRLVQQLDAQIALLNQQIAATPAWDNATRWNLTYQRDTLASFRSQLGYVSASGWGLLHIGRQALDVRGDVAVQRNAGMFNVSGTPAMTLSGRYRQGLPGPQGGFKSYRSCNWLGQCGNWIRTTSCGAMVQNQQVPLSPNSEWEPPGPLFAFPSLWVLSTPALDSGGSTSCGNPTDPFFADPFGSSSPRSAPAWSGAEPRVALPAACAPNGAGVVAFDPGFYDTAATTVLNRWFRGDGCGNVTFWFKPGDYYFDVVGGDIMDGTKGALRFDNPNAKWVWGVPRGWDPAVAQPDASRFPAACVTGSARTGANDGVTVTLSGRTTLAHVHGLVAMCGRRLANGDPVVLVEQQQPAAGVTAKWAAEPATATTSGPLYTAGPPFSNPAQAAATVAGPRPSEYPAQGDPYDASETGAAATPPAAGVTCGNSCDPQLTFEGFGHSGSLPESGAVSALTLHLRARANVRVSKDPAQFPLDPGYQCPPDGCSATTVNVDYGGSSPCVVQVPDVLAGDRGAYVTRTVDLSSCVGSGRLADASQLRSAKVTVQPKLRCVEFHAAGPEGGVEPICHPADPMTFDVDYAWLDADVEGVGEPSALSSQVDIAPADPAHRNSITFFGPVHLPYTDVEVQWRGGRWSMPVFAGGVVARGLASWSVDPGTVGVLASPDVDIGQTRVLLRARRSGSSGPLAGSAIVRVDAPLVGAGSRRVEDWALCSEEWATSTSGCR